MINRLTVLNEQNNSKLKSNFRMNGYIDEPEPQFSRLTTMGSKVDKRMYVAILLSLLSKQQKRSTDVRISADQLGRKYETIICYKHIHPVK